MEVYADFRQKVKVNPIDVIRNLIEDAIGHKNWITEEDGKYYVCTEERAGPNSYDVKKEIDVESYKYVKALQLVLLKLLNSSEQ